MELAFMRKEKTLGSPVTRPAKIAFDKHAQAGK
jgi:hypothetical protein